MMKTVRVLGIREDRVNALRYAGILHDVGKLGVPTKILQKTSGLSDDEFSRMVSDAVLEGQRVAAAKAERAAEGEEAPEDKAVETSTQTVSFGGDSFGAKAQA